MSHAEPRAKPVEIQAQTVALGDRGRLVLPATIRNRLNLKVGDRFILKIEADGSIRLVSVREQVLRAQGMFADTEPHRRLADELIHERRQAASEE